MCIVYLFDIVDFSILTLGGSLFWYYLSALLIFLVSSLAHELGHIIALLSFKIPVHKLSIGLGPSLWGKNLKKSSIRRVRLKLMPFGLGAAFDGDHPRFQSLNLWQKMLIFSAGILVNISIAGLVLVFSHPLNVFQPTYSGYDDPTNITRAFVVLNILLALFQLLPFSRFDGGRLLDCVLKKFLPAASHDFVINLKVLITLFVSLGIFNVYRHWI